MVTDRPDLALGILTADCGPVLLADAEAGVAGAAHAGWGGALAGVLEATVAAMADLRRRAGTASAPCSAPRSGLRPTRSAPSSAPASAPMTRGQRRALSRPGAGDRFHFDLPGYVLSRLAAAGVAASWTGHCTYADPSRFYSYRRSVHRQEADYGRLISVIRAPA